MLEVIGDDGSRDMIVTRRASCPTGTELGLQLVSSPTPRPSGRGVLASGMRDEIGPSEGGKGRFSASREGGCAKIVRFSRTEGSVRSYGQVRLSVRPHSVVHGAFPDHSILFSHFEVLDLYIVLLVGTIWP